MSTTAPFPEQLVREDLRDFTGYSSARTSAVGVPARIWLNANESGLPNDADGDGANRRYPDPQPAALVDAFADLWATTPDRVVVGRGSDELIELVVRSVCRPGADGIVVASWQRLAFDLAADLSAIDHRSVIHQLRDRELVTNDQLLANERRLCHPARRGSTIR